MPVRERSLLEVASAAFVQAAMAGDDAAAVQAFADAQAVDLAGPRDELASWVQRAVEAVGALRDDVDVEPYRWRP